MRPQPGDEVRESLRELVTRLGNTPGKFKVSLVIVIIVVVVVSIPLILFFSPSNQLRGGGGGNGQSSLISPFNSIHSLKGNSTIVALGTYSSINSTWNFRGTVFTIFQVNVTSYLKGSGPSSIYVEGVPTPSESLQTMGQEYVLFLSVVKPCLPSPPAPCPSPPAPHDTIDYIPTGGPQGKFLVKSGLVYGMKNAQSTRGFLDHG